MKRNDSMLHRKRTWTEKTRPILEGDGCLLVTLSDGQVAKIDYEDRKIAEGWNWSSSGCRATGLYASRGATVDGKVKSIILHREILGLGCGEIGDHINGDTLDNRRSNLRKAGRSGNARNRGIASNNTSGFKGVCFRRDRGTWIASIGSNGKHRKIGTFKTAELAAVAYDEAARKLFGEFATVNFPLNINERSAA